jgi:hypothetical protein
VGKSGASVCSATRTYSTASDAALRDRGNARAVWRAAAEAAPVQEFRRLNAPCEEDRDPSEIASDMCCHPRSEREAQHRRWQYVGTATVTRASSMTANNRKGRWRRFIARVAGSHNAADPRAEIEVLETWSARATLLILVGILVELAALFWFAHPSMGWGEISAAAAADVLIGGGLAIEYVCIVRAVEATERLQREADKKVARANADAERARAEAAAARERLALTDERLLHERRLNARDRSRLEFLERAVLPRTITEPQWNALVASLKGSIATLNIAILDKPEPMRFGLELNRLLGAAEILTRPIFVPPSCPMYGVRIYRVTEAAERVGQILWQTAAFCSGSTGMIPEELRHWIRAGEDCLLIGENDAAMHGRPGYPGDGIDEHGEEIPNPQ